MNIEKYRFSDSDIHSLDFDVCSKELAIYLVAGADMCVLDKDDVIALAKHFKLTPEDIKE